MVLVALTLMAAGLAVSLFGYKLFALLMPLFGLVSGIMVGFIGFQGVFGKGAISTTVAVFVAVMVGVLMALLSFAFFEVAVAVLAGLVIASLFSYLGIALGLGANGLIVFLLGLAGFIVGINWATTAGATARFVMTLTSFAGVAFVLASVFLVAGSVSLDQLFNDGIIASVLRVVDQSFLWLFVWLAGSLIARELQARLALTEVLNDSYQFKPAKARK